VPRPCVIDSPPSTCDNTDGRGGGNRNAVEGGWDRASMCMGVWAVCGGHVVGVMVVGDGDLVLPVARMERNMTSLRFRLAGLRGFFPRVVVWGVFGSKRAVGRNCCARAP
jgi:hypothetical protein